MQSVRQLEVMMEKITGVTLEIFFKNDDISLSNPSVYNFASGVR